MFNINGFSMMLNDVLKPLDGLTILMQCRCGFKVNVSLAETFPSLLISKFPLKAFPCSGFKSGLLILKWPVQISVLAVKISVLDRKMVGHNMSQLVLPQWRQEANCASSCQVRQKNSPRHRVDIYATVPGSKTSCEKLKQWEIKGNPPKKSWDSNMGYNYPRIKRG